MNLNFLKPIDNKKAYRLLNVGSTIFVGSHVGTDFDIMAAAWNTALNIDPCRIVVVIDKDHYTRKLIDASGEFVVSIPSVKASSELLYVGSESKNDNRQKLDKIKDRLIDVKGFIHPLPDDCLAHLSFKVIEMPENQKTYDLFIGELVHAVADSRYFDGHFKSDVADDGSLTVHYVSGEHCFKLGQEFIPQAIK